MASLSTLALVAAALSRAAATAQGALKLDNMTFDKAVAMPGVTLLAKFDKSYPYGEKEDAFKELCKLAYPVKGFLVGEIPVQEYGDKENEDVQNRFGVKTDEFPAYLLFKGSTDSYVKFQGFPDPTVKRPPDWDDDEDGEWEPPMLSDPTVETLVIWLRKNGVKMPSIGTIAELNEMAHQFMKGGFSDDVLTKAKTLAEEEHKNDRKAPIYIKTMQKIKDKGKDYLQKELARVQKIMDGKITPEKKEELSEKVKILNVFAEE